MDARLAPLYEIFKLNSRIYLNCLEGMDDDQASWRAHENHNTAAFIALHLVESRYYYAGQIGVSATNPFDALTKGRKSIAAMQGLPAMDEQREAWKKVTGELRVRFGQMTADDLAKPMDSKMPFDDKTVLGFLGFMMQHESYHIGQLALLRKQVGLPAMSYR